MRNNKLFFILLMLGYYSLMVGCQAEKEKDFFGYGEEEVSLMLAGLIINRNYVDLNDGTVLDSHSGLIWQKCSEGQSYRSGENDCRGTQAPASLQINDSVRWGAIPLAYCSNNTWSCNSLAYPHALVGNSQYIVPGTSEVYNRCNARNNSNGFPGWRAPTVVELNNLTVGGRNALLQIFPDTIEGLYWTAWGQPEDLEGTRAIAVNFDRMGFGEQKVRSKTERLYVRCVRNATPN